MKKIIKRTGIIVFTAAILLSITGCEDPPSGGPRTPSDIKWSIAESRSDTDVDSEYIIITFNSKVNDLADSHIEVTGVAVKDAPIEQGTGNTWKIPITVNSTGHAFVKIEKTGVEVGTKSVNVFKANQTEDDLPAKKIKITGIGGGYTGKLMQVGLLEQNDAAFMTDILTKMFNDEYVAIICMNDEDGAISGSEITIPLLYSPTPVDSMPPWKGTGSYYVGAVITDSSGYFEVLISDTKISFTGETTTVAFSDLKKFSFSATLPASLIGFLAEKGITTYANWTSAGLPNLYTTSAMTTQVSGTLSSLTSTVYMNMPLDLLMMFIRTQWPDYSPIVGYTVTANGTAGSSTTTQISFVFDETITGLTADDITITNGTGSATKGSLTGSGRNRTLNLTNVLPGTISVSINKAGISSIARTVTLNFAVITYSVSANGVSGVTSSTQLNFTFSRAVDAYINLAASDITITNGTGSAVKGSITGSGNTRQLAISGVTQGNVTVSINRSGIIEAGNKTVAVYEAQQKSLTITGLSAYNGKTIGVALLDSNSEADLMTALRPAFGVGSIPAGMVVGWVETLTGGSANIPLFLEDTDHGDPWKGSGEYYVGVVIYDNFSMPVIRISSAKVNFNTANVTKTFASDFKTFPFKYDFREIAEEAGLPSADIGSMTINQVLSGLMGGQNFGYAEWKAFTNNEFGRPLNLYTTTAMNTEVNGASPALASLPIPYTVYAEIPAELLMMMMSSRQIEGTINLNNIPSPAPRIFIRITEPVSGFYLETEFPNMVPGNISNYHWVVPMDPFDGYMDNMEGKPIVIYLRIVPSTGPEVLHEVTRGITVHGSQVDFAKDGPIGTVDFSTIPGL